MYVRKFAVELTGSNPLVAVVLMNIFKRATKALTAAVAGASSMNVDYGRVESRKELASHNSLPHF